MPRRLWGLKLGAYLLTVFFLYLHPQPQPTAQQLQLPFALDLGPGLTLNDQSTFHHAPHATVFC